MVVGLRSRSARVVGRFTARGGAARRAAALALGGAAPLARRASSVAEGLGASASPALSGSADRPMLSSEIELAARPMPTAAPRPKMASAAPTATVRRFTDVTSTCSTSSGSRTSQRVPPSGRSSSRTEPPQRSASASTTDSPRPVPSASREASPR